MAIHGSIFHYISQSNTGKYMYRSFPRFDRFYNYMYYMYMYLYI
jgi:hypothetical protein